MASCLGREGKGIDQRKLCPRSEPARVQKALIRLRFSIELIYTFFENDVHLAGLRAVPGFQAFPSKLCQEWQHIQGEPE